MRGFIRALVVLSLLGMFSACNSAPMRRNQNWDALIERRLPGIWTSDRFGRLLISCDGYIHLDDQGGFDLSNTGLKNAKIVELEPKELLIETMPFIKDHYAMARYPYEEGEIVEMNFWGREWKRAEERECAP